jgi:hypothetical protein
MRVGGEHVDEAERAELGAACWRQAGVRNEERAVIDLGDEPGWPNPNDYWGNVEFDREAGANDATANRSLTVAQESGSRVGRRAKSKGQRGTRDLYDVRWA